MDLIRNSTVPEGSTATWRDRKRYLWLIGLVVPSLAFIGYGQAPFTASFFFRNHTAELASLAGQFGLKSAGFLGLSLGLIGGTAGVAGAWLGGVIADRYGAKDIRAYVAAPAVAKGEMFLRSKTHLFCVSDGKIDLRR